MHSAFLDTVIARMDDSVAIFERILDDEHFRQALTDLCTDRVGREERSPG